MKTINFPYIAMALGLLMLMVVLRGSVTDTEGSTALPMLTLLIVNEFAFFLTAIGIYIGIRQIAASGYKLLSNPLYSLTILICILLCIQFVLLGIKLWPL
jgi:hypothetical protein